tara:strand:+ start:283 stop:2961 length:2679 start_codon:yes stop_codon:yes gene_type:complete
MVDKYQERQQEREDDLKNLGILAGLSAVAVGAVPALRKGKQLFQLGKKYYQGIGKKVENGALDTPPPKTDIEVIDKQAEFISQNTPTDLPVLGPSQIRKTFESDPDVAKIAQANREAKELNRRIAAEVNENPLSYGGQMNNPNAERWNQYTPPGGSSFYDFVALHPSGIGRKSKTAIDPNIWVNDIKAGLRGEFGGAKYTGTKFTGEKIKLSPDELADANIAIFDNDGKLVGGFLNNAVKAEFPVSKEMLRRLIENSPAGRTTSRRFGHIMEGPLQDAENYLDLHDSLITQVRRKMDSQYVKDIVKDIDFDNLTVERKAFNNLSYQIYGDGYENFKNDRLRLLEFAQGDSQGANNFKNAGFNILIKTDAGTAKDMNYHPAKFMDAVEKFEERFNINLLSQTDKANLALRRQAADDSIEAALQAGKSDNYDYPLDFASTENSRHFTYRIRGAERYFEQPVFFRDKDFLNRDGFFEPGQLIRGKGLGSHYDNLKISATEDVGEQLYHMRYSMRTKGADDLANTTNEDIKVFTIDEIQADIQQSNRALLQADKDKKRVNPVNLMPSKNIEKDYVAAQYEKVLEKIEKFEISQSTKDYNIVKNEIKKFESALGGPMNVKTTTGIGKFEELNPNAPNTQVAQFYNKMAEPKINRQGEPMNYYEGNENITFQPFFNRQEQANHNIKELINMVASRKYKKDTWVAVNPVERLHALKRDPLIGNYEFYGTARGKAGFEGGKAKTKIKDPATGEDTFRDFSKDDYNKMAALPKAMKKLADKYGTEAKTIKIAKSDPKKPYKVITALETEGSTSTRLNNYMGKGKLPEDELVEHIVAFKNEQDAIDYINMRGGALQVIKVDADDPALYYDAFAIKVKPNMKDKNFKLYGYHKGGMVVDIFAW